MPNLLWIMLVVSVILLISILFLLRRKKFFWAILLLAIAGGAWYGYQQYTRTNRDIATVKADIRLPAIALVKEYEINDSSANKKFLGKIIETDGLIKEVKKDESGYYTIVMGETGNLSSVRCSMDTVHQQDAALLKIGSPAILRGVCTGFNKDEIGLGSDVILNRCVIISTTKK